MKYFLMTKTNDDAYTQTFDEVGDLNAAITTYINDGFEESNKALSTRHVSGKAKYYAVVQGIQVTTKVLSVTV